MMHLFQLRWSWNVQNFSRCQVETCVFKIELFRNVFKYLAKFVGFSGFEGFNSNGTYWAIIELFTFVSVCVYTCLPHVLHVVIKHCVTVSHYLYHF